MVDEAGGLLAVWGGMGEGDLDELLGGAELVFDPLEVGVDGGQDLLGAEVFFQFPMGEQACGAILAGRVVWVLDLGGDDAVHGVAVVAGVDGGWDVEGLAEFDGFRDRGFGDGFAGRWSDEKWSSWRSGFGTDGNLN